MRTLRIVVIASVVAFLPAATHALPLLDPGFESGTEVAGGIGGWDAFGAAAFSMSFAHSGSRSMALIGRNVVSGAFQELPASPGEVYTLTGFGLVPQALTAGNSFGGIQITFFNSVGTNLGTVETSPGNARGDFSMTPSSPTNVWIPLSVTATAPATTVAIQAFAIYIDFTGATQGIYADDLALTRAAVPEPATLALMGLGAFGFAAVRRYRISRV
jgi:hypothetical protein